MTPEEAEKIIHEAQRRGAVIRMEDSRLSGLIQWFYGVVGVAIVGGIGALMNGQARTNESIAQINQNIAVLIQRQDFNDRTNAQQDRHMEATDSRVEHDADRIGSLERSTQSLVIRR
jgi:hypothetical protein